MNEVHGGVVVHGRERPLGEGVQEHATEEPTGGAIGSLHGLGAGHEVEAAVGCGLQGAALEQSFVFELIHLLELSVREPKGVKEVESA